MEFRKYFEPKYGPVAPEVEIRPAGSIDFDNLSTLRVVISNQDVARYQSQIERCNVYPELTKIAVKKTTFTYNDITIPIWIYKPIGEGPHPVLVFFHGGSFMLYSPDYADWVMRYISRFGNAVVVSVDYRLAPEVKFPGGLEDSYAAVQWASEHMDELDGDPDRLLVGGESSGGNFAAAVALMARDRKGPKIAKQFLWWPLTDGHPAERTQSELKYGSGDHYLWYDSRENQFEQYYGDTDRRSPYASPLWAEDVSGLPPAVILSGECDPLLDQAVMYAAKLEDAGVNVDYYLAEGMLHAFIFETHGKSFEALNFVVNHL